MKHKGIMYIMFCGINHIHFFQSLLDLNVKQHYFIWIFNWKRSYIFKGLQLVFPDLLNGICAGERRS